MWKYKGKVYKTPGEFVGFVYLIINLTENKKYLGKKLFTSAAYKQIKKKRKKIRKPSNWLSYFGSNTTLQADVKRLGKKAFKREILILCKNKSECSYAESYLIFKAHAIVRVDFYNDWNSCKITRKHVAGSAALTAELDKLRLEDYL